MSNYSTNGHTNGHTNGASVQPNTEREKEGGQSLKDLGFEFRFVPCSRHAQSSNNDSHHHHHHNNNQGISNDSSTPSSSSSLAQTVLCDSCSTRLFHHDEMLSIETYPQQQHIPKGKIFDTVQTQVQDQVQRKICHDFSMHHITLFGDVHALVSDSLVRDNDDDDDDDVDRDDPDEHNDDDVVVDTKEEQDGDNESVERSPYDGSIIHKNTNNRRKKIRPNTLIVIGGKGISRCGLVSVQQTLGAGMERGTCSYHIQQALQRKWHVIILDPNAQGTRGGFDVITRSLDRLLFMDARPESISSRVMGMDDEDDDDDDDDDDNNNNNHSKHLFFFCHSAAGGYIVRYLLDQTVAFQRRIAKICFSDSTHRLSWADPKKHKYLYDVLLQDRQRSLYIRNNSLGRDYPLYQTPQPGDDCGDTVDHWWIHRYGNLRTVWAGTADHSLMVWEARKVVWDFFENKLDENTDVKLTSNRRRVRSVLRQMTMP